MVDSPDERFFTVRWFLRAGHRHAGHIDGNLKRISTSSLAFLSPEPYIIGSLAEMEICLDPTTQVRCVVRIEREEPKEKGQYVYAARIDSFREGHRVILAGTLLELRRAEYRERF
jgi:hypothetical protein